jgi:hypothetical protein
MPVNAIFSIYGHSLKARTQQFVPRSRNLSGFEKITKAKLLGLTTVCALALPNSYSMASSSIVSQCLVPTTATKVAKNGTKSSQNAVVKQTAQTQTERKISLFRQFMYCLLANQVIIYTCFISLCHKKNLGSV